jgi:hypothetical protein
MAIDAGPRKLSPSGTYEFGMVVHTGYRLLTGLGHYGFGKRRGGAASRVSAGTRSREFGANAMAEVYDSLTLFMMGSGHELQAW